MAELSYLSRLEPRPRENDFRRSLAAETHDPLWFLARQWQLGKFNGEDSGSLAYTQYSVSTSKMPRWLKNGAEVPLDGGAPLEPQTLREPFEPDLGLKVELGQDFADLLSVQVGDDAVTEQLLGAFRALAPFQIPAALPDSDLNPVDPATQRFLLVCAARSLDGVALYNLGLALAGGGSLPAGITTDPTRAAQISAALTTLVERVRAVFGEIGTGDPSTWQPGRLEYRLQVVGANPSGPGKHVLDAHPDSDGEYEWFSFDVASKNTTTAEQPPTTKASAVVPAHVRFDGMPASRFWNFEENTLALPDVGAETDDLLKVLALDFMLVHANDWYVLPHELSVGSLAKVNYLVVRDVFGKLTVVDRADANTTAAGTNRWTMFSIADRSGATEGLTDYFILPQTSGSAMHLGSVLEDVRFGRDEMANMAWAIERVTTSPIGEQRAGSERDAEIDARRKPPSLPPAPNDFPLRYEIETEVRANWIPLFPMQPNSNNVSIVLEKGAALKDTGTGPATVPALGSVLNPDGLTPPYRIQEEEIPRAGLKVERVVYRARWVDGSTHLWVQRRRSIGAGESQSGLKFDQAQPKDG